MDLLGYGLRWNPDELPGILGLDSDTVPHGSGGSFGYYRFCQ